MNRIEQIPFIPASAPFTAEQRAWLNGFFVGLLSNAQGETPASAAGTVAREPLLIGFGSQTGSAEGLAKKIARESEAKGFTATVKELNAIQLAELQGKFLLVTSTWGDGEPPDNAAAFWKAVMAAEAPSLSSLNFAVLALGDRNYSNFCGAGKRLDERLAELGGKRLVARQDCDVDYESPARSWVESIWPALSGKHSAVTEVPPAPLEKPTDKPSWSRANPFVARLVENRLLNAGSEKETRHFAISLAGSDLKYEPGDALGVVPSNCPEMVEELIKLAGVERDEPVDLGGGKRGTIHEALLRFKEIRRPGGDLLKAVAERSAHSGLRELLDPAKKPELDRYLYDREVIDLLHETGVKFKGAEFLGLLSKLQPRLYSISSSPKAHPGEVHLTVAAVRYQTLGRARKGVCSTYLADRVTQDGPVSVFVQNSHFRLPGDGKVPVIMVGPGTGIAPFRAFLEERLATGATGRNWLFFGDQRRQSDFLYRDELEKFIADGYLHRLDLAFSRDQQEKVYVQQRMLENGPELWSWLEQGAHLYVCGDAKRMAKDVDAALHQVIQQHGGNSAEKTAEYVSRMKTEKRYQRDVY